MQKAQQTEKYGQYYQVFQEEQSRHQDERTNHFGSGIQAMYG
jgi:hypothetical protein